jgi:hypothetical protein
MVYGEFHFNFMPLNCFNFQPNNLKLMFEFISLDLKSYKYFVLILFP